MSSPRTLDRINLTDTTHSEWLDLRRLGIGGSDAGAVMGVSKYGNALSVYESKVNPQDDRDESEFFIGGSSEAAYHGTQLEGYVADCFEAVTLREAHTLNELLIFNGHGFPMTANLDRYVSSGTAIEELFDGTHDVAVLECKTAGAFVKKEWANDGIPPAYLYQVLHYLEVTGWDIAYIAVLIGGQKFEYRTVLRDDYLFDIEELVERECALWANVRSLTPPVEEF